MSANTLRAHLLLTLAPTGTVQEASISTGSGDADFDDSLVRDAYQASPLPLPREPGAFVPKVNICVSPKQRNCE